MKKNRLKMAVDIAMTALLPLLMAYSLIGEYVHEVLGILIFALFTAHHILNRGWWTTICKGKYNAGRALNTMVNLLLAAIMLIQPISGILMSKYVLKGLTISGSITAMRTIHMAIAYWGFLLMSFHLGLHIRMIGANAKRHMSKGALHAVLIIFSLIAAYGIYAFEKRGIGDYLLMKTMFAYFDFSEPRIFFILDYISIIVLVAEAAFWMQSGLKRRKP